MDHSDIRALDKYEELREDIIIIDSCLYPGSPIPFEYDPLVAAVTVFGNNRYESVAGMTNTLKELQI